VPEQPNEKLRHPDPPPATRAAGAVPPYAELDVATNFSFLRGASHPDELAHRAAERGHRAIGIADRNSLAGVVRAHQAVSQLKDKTGCDLKLLVGCRLVMSDAPDVLVWAVDRGGYANLCQLLTLGKRRAAKAECDLSLADLLNRAGGLMAAVDPRGTGVSPVLSTEARAGRPCDDELPLLREAFGDRLSIVATCPFGRDDIADLSRLAGLSRRSGVPLLATNHVHYHDPARRPLQDVLTCVRHGCTVHDAGHRLFPNAERHVKHPYQMHALFEAHPAAVHRTVDVAERCTFSLDELRYEYPHEVVPAGRTAIAHLTDLALAGAAERYPDGVPPHVVELVGKELALIEQLQYEPYFLTVHDLVRFARSRGILCQGRGSAANSAVCYCLGVTAVDPDRINVLFERFVSGARKEPPDIDIDFEHERREEVIQYVYAKYGRDRAGMTAEVITYRGRSAVRDVGKALGLGPDTVDEMAKRLEWWDRGTLSPQQVREAGLDPADAAVRRVVELSTQLLGFPRHLGQHVGGMVMTRGPLCELVPIENASMEGRTVIEWDKDDIDELGILKVDILGLGMLTAIAKCLRLLPTPMALHTIPTECPATYDMICDADTVGVFQIESRAQMSMLPRLRPRTFYDLVIEVAIVRPGPIQGDMVHPYLRRRDGTEPVTYPTAAIEEVLERTLGVPLFQEQAMSLVMVGAGFTADRADQLRRAMAAWKRHGGLEQFHEEVVDGMRGNGYSLAFAEQCFNQIRGFGEYGFPESHAASFAGLVYASAWLKRHHPAEFCCAILNSQPMGFYAPAQLVRDAQDHGVTVRAIDVNASDWDCTLEPLAPSPGTPGEGGGEGLRAANDSRLVEDPHPNPLPAYRERGPEKRTWGAAGPAVRLGFRLIKGMREAHAAAILKARPFTSVAQFHRATGLPAEAVRRLAEADAFGSLDRTRRPAAWDALGLPDGPTMAEPADPPPLALPPMPLGQEVMADYGTAGLSLKCHPVSLVRPLLTARGIITAAQLREPGRRGWVSVAGLVLVRQRPGTAAGIVFMTLEDETGTANLIVRPAVYDRYRPAARHAILLQAEGRVERKDAVVHLLAYRMTDLGELLVGYAPQSRDFH
jgi:error-prone DNA polymerase